MRISILLFFSSSHQIYLPGKPVVIQRIIQLTAPEKQTKIELEINVHHLRDNSIAAGHVQNPFSDSDEILCH